MQRSTRAERTPFAGFAGPVGAKLIIRSGRDFTWTAEGRTLLTAAEAMDAATSQATLSLQDASDAYLRHKGRPQSHADLARHQLVLHIEPMDHIAPLRWMEPHLAAAQLLRVDNLETACQTIAADGGIDVLPALIGDAVPNLRRVFDERIGLNTGWIVYQEALRDNAHIRAVTRALAECFERHAATFSGASAAG